MYRHQKYFELGIFFVMQNDVLDNVTLYQKLFKWQYG